MSEIITVGICSIGSGVGQSVIDSCRLSRLPLRTVGLGNNPLAFGLYECDENAFLPSYYDSNYVDELLAVCKTKGIDVLVPGHDDEAFLLAKNKEKFIEKRIKVIVSDAELISVCRAKETMAESFPAVADLFVKSYTLDEANALAASGEISFPLFAKPRDGYASKGVSIITCIGDLKRIDETVILQEVAIPHSGDPYHDSYVRSLQSARNLQAAEISVQLLADKEGVIRAQCATYNKLNNGIPIEILPYENEKVEAAVSRLVPFLQDKGLRGPINVQGRLTDRGFKIFEFNPRFTGITGLRAAMGFNEVAACIRHWVSDEPLEKLFLNSRVFGIRQTANKAVHISRNERVEQLYREIHGQSECNGRTPVILVTGSTGAVGRALINLLLQQGEFEIWTLDRSKETAKKLHPTVSGAYNWSDLASGVLSLGAVDKIVHLASARPFHGPQEISESLARGMQLFTFFAEYGAGQIIYASSQSVYGSQPGIPWTEDLPALPETLYAHSKYALEQHLSSLAKLKPNLSTVILRIGAVTGNDSTIRQYEALARLTTRAVENRVVEVYGGDQVLGRIHYRDVVTGIIRVIKQQSCSRYDIYNLGMESSYTLDEIVNKVIGAVEHRFPGKSIRVVSQAESALHKSHAVDATRFISAYRWKPKYSLINIIEELLDSQDPEKNLPNSIINKKLLSSNYSVSQGDS